MSLLTSFSFSFRGSMSNRPLRRASGRHRRAAGLAVALLAAGLGWFGAASSQAAPTITRQPQSLIVTQGATVTFRVIAQAAPPAAYQWLFVGSGPLAGQTDSTLILGQVGPAQAGGYRVTVTDASGSATSQVATLTVLVTVDIRLDPAHPHADAEARVLALGGVVLDSSEYFNRITFQIDSTRVPEVAALPFVVAWQPHPTPVEQLDGSRASINIPAVQAPPWSTSVNPYNLAGSGVKAGVWDGGQPGTPNATAIGILSGLNVPAHADLAGRWIPEEMSPAYWFNQLHPTHVSSIMAGDGSQSLSQGGTALQWAGMAPQAEIHTWDFGGAPETEMLNGRLAGKIDLSQNSWAYIGSSQCPMIYGSYMLQCGDADKLVRLQKLPIFVAAGNYQSAILGGYGTVTPLGTAKNVITIGAVTKTDAMAGFSSWGPTLDGRLKPDVVAVGVLVKACDVVGNGYTYLSGTSMACPAVSGLGALLIEKYRQLYATDPDPALLKAVLCNTATDFGNPGPDYRFGYGKVNALPAVETLQCGHFLVETNGLASGGVASYSLTIQPGCTNLRVLLAYSDQEFVSWACNATTLINDLDLTLVDPSTTVHLPLTLNPALPSNPALPLANHRDPVEQVVVANPAPGTWQIKVQGLSVPAGPQPFVLTWWDSCGCTAVTSTPPPCVSAPTNLVAWWPLDEPPGATLLAEIQNGINATPQPAALNLGGPNAIPGLVAGGMYVFGPTRYGEAALSPLLDLGASDFSIDCWVRPVQCGQSWRHPIVDKLDLGNPTSGYALYHESGLVKLALGDPTAGGQLFASPTPLAVGAWNFIGVSVRRGVGVAFYINGVVTTITTPIPLPNPNNGSRLWLGGSRLPYTGGYCETGLDEVEIFNRAVSPQEYKILYAADKAGKCKSRLCGTKFEDLNGNGLQDPGESGLGGWVIEIHDAAGNLVTSTVTDTNGHYCFTNLPGGFFTVNEVLQPGWLQTLPTGGLYFVTNGLALGGGGFDFGNQYTNCQLTPWTTDFILQSGMSNGVPLPPGSLDPDWLLSCAPAGFTGQAMVISPAFIPWVWLPNGPNSQWIGPNLFGSAPDGVYCYDHRFYLPCTNHVAITGQFSSDNGARIYLNAVPTAAFSPTYAYWTPVNLTSGFVPGWNSLQIIVTNIGGPTGIRVELTNSFRCCCQPQQNCINLSCPTNVTVPLTSSNSAVVTYPFTPTSACGTVVWSQCQPPSGSSFPVGTTPVHCVAWDALGNVACCDFTVTVTSCQLTPWLTNFVLQTGMNGATPLPAGAPDPAWVLSCAPAGFTGTPTVISPGAIPGSWVPNGPASQWIGPNVNGTGPDGVYCYSHRFHVACTNEVALAGRFASDNGAQIYLNSLPTAAFSPTFASWTPVNLTSGFVPGWNTLLIMVTNIGGPTGIRVELTNSFRCCCPGQSCISLTCPSNITATACSSNGALVTYSVGLGTGCPTPPTSQCLPPSGSLFPVGTTPVHCNAWDQAGNLACCDFTVTVLPDLLPPQLTCPTGLVASCVCGTNALLFFNVAATDNCSNTVTVLCQIAPSGPFITSPYSFPAGSTLVQCTATDGSGNTATCSFPVTVTPDLQPPTLLCPSNIIRVTCNQQELVYFKAKASDNCSTAVSVVFKLQPSGIVITSPWWFPIGTNWVQCVATDACGNSTTCLFAVIIRSGDLWENLAAGFPDCYLLPTEPAFPGPTLLGAYPGGPWKPFDSTALCRLLGHTFKLRTNCTVREAWLLLRMKPRPPTWFNPCPPANDRLYLGLPSPSPGSWLWNKQIGAGGGLLPNPWISQFYKDCAYNFTFNLSSLPLGSFNLIPHLNAFKRLDFLVQDNTIVDAARLRVHYCPCFSLVHGLGTSLSGGAIVSGPNGLQQLMPDPDQGAPGNLTARLGLGTADGVALNLTDLDFTGRLAFSAATSEGPTPCVLLLGQSDEALTLSAAPSPDLKRLRVRVWAQGSLTAEAWLAANEFDQFLSGPAGSGLAQFALLDRTNYNLRWPKAVPLLFAKTPVTGDRVEVSFDTPTPVEPLSELVLSGEAVTSIGLQAAFLQACGGFQPTPENALCTVVNGQFIASPLMPEDGNPVVLNLTLAAKEEFRVRLAPPYGEFDPVPASALLATSSRGLINGQEQDLDRLTLRRTAADLWQINVDFTPLGSATHRLRLFNNGVLVLDRPGHTGPVGLIADLPSTLGRLGGAAPGLWLYRSQPTLVVVDGTNYSGNDLRLLAESPRSVVSALTGLRIEATQPEALIVASIETGPPACQIELPESTPDGILLRWGGEGSMLQQAHNLPGPWLDQPSPAGEWLITPPASQEPARFFRVRQN